MLVTWRYRKRTSLIQSFDPRAWVIFYACFMAATLVSWDLRLLLPLAAIALVTLLTSGIRWHEMRRAFLFMMGFVLFFTILTFLTGRGGSEVYETEHAITQLRAPFFPLWLAALADDLSRAHRFCHQPVCARL